MDFQRFIKVVLVSVLATAAFAVAVPNLVSMGDGIYAMKNMMEVQFIRGVPVGPIAAVDGVAQTGLGSFDALCRRYNVAAITPLYPGADPDYEVDLSRFYMVTFAADQGNVLAVVDDFRGDPYMETVYPALVAEVDYIPDDQWFGLQWNLKHVDDHDVDADGAWDINKGDANLAVAIADTGVDWEHPDLANNIWYNMAEKNGTPGVDDDGNGYMDDDKGWDWVTGVSGTSGEDTQLPDNDPMDYNGHGTHCSGIASAVTDNSIGIAGVAFKTKIMALRIGWDSNGTGYVGLDWGGSAMYYAADKGAVSFNCSWGSSYTPGLAGGFSYALSKGVLICSSAGNNNNQNPSWLCSQTETVAVASTNVWGKKSDFSSYGSWVDVSAPGSQIYSTYRHAYGEHAYTTLSGTSMSCPHVVGEAALVRTKNPSWRWTEIRNDIVNTCDNIDGLNPGYEGLLGAGIINCHRAISDPSVELLSFTARARGEAVALRWATSHEYNHAGFNLYRRAKGDNAAASERINDEMIRGHSPYVYTDAEVQGDTTYEYVLEDVDLSGNATRHGPIQCRVSGRGLPTAYALNRPWPNPARDSATVTYSLPEGHRGNAEVALYDLSGRKVATLASGAAAPGEYKVQVDVAGFAPGVYLCRLNAGAFSAATKVVVAH